MKLYNIAKLIGKEVEILFTSPTGENPQTTHGIIVGIVENQDYQDCITFINKRNMLNQIETYRIRDVKEVW